MRCVTVMPGVVSPMVSDNTMKDCNCCWLVCIALVVKFVCCVHHPIEGTRRSKLHIRAYSVFACVPTINRVPSDTRMLCLSLMSLLQRTKWDAELRNYAVNARPNKSDGNLWPG